MTGFVKIREEIQLEQKTRETQMEKLKVQFQSSANSSCYFKPFEREAKGLQRKITKTRMRMRSMEINLGTDTFTEIDEADDEFDPTELNLTHERPVGRLPPAVSLPHATLVWQRTGAVARWRHAFHGHSLLTGIFPFSNLCLLI